MNSMNDDNTSRQLASQSYKLPIEDQEFLLRDELRGIRFQLEYSKTELLLRDWGIRSTIIVFGSARVPSPEQAELLRAGKVEGVDKATAARRLLLAPYYEEARKFGRIVSLQGGALNPKAGIRDNVIATGGGPGIMEAANRGASEVNAPTIGFNIALPHEQYPNPYTTPDLTFRFHYFAMRKMHLAMRSNALAVFPGGFGTMDEFFEILTLRQTGKSSPKPVVLVGRDYWNGVVNFQRMVDHAMIDKEDLDLFAICDSAEEAWAALLDRGLILPE
ncbi:MAG TPA: LOG family protein [Dongiaceae bacterium]|nr:LOG family protein [Dongiaceae bacterium]